MPDEVMTPDLEFSALRTTIASRGTVRVVLVPLSIAAWATLARGGFLPSPLGLTALVPLAVLFAGFEAVRALHVAIERIGRYLQVFHEGRPGSREDLPKWETTAMADGARLPGAGVDPLFTWVFVGATLVNAGLALGASERSLDAVAVLAAHAALVGRMWYARRAAALQRAHDLAHFTRLKQELGSTLPSQSQD